MTPTNLFEQMQVNYERQKSRAARAEADRMEQEQRRESIKQSLQNEVEQDVRVIDDARVHTDLRERVDAVLQQEIEARKDAAIKAAERDRKRREASERKKAKRFRSGAGEKFRLDEKAKGKLYGNDDTAGTRTGAEDPVPEPLPEPEYYDDDPDFYKDMGYPEDETGVDGLVFLDRDHLITEYGDFPEAEKKKGGKK